MLYPLVHHPSADVHAPALSLIRMIIERRGSAALPAEGGYSQLAALLQSLAASPQLVSAVLSLIHQRPIDVNTRFEYNRLEHLTSSL
jgi:hypothetical protein